MVTLTITKPHGVTTLSVYDPEKACSYDLPPIPEMVDGLPMFSQIIEVGSDLMVIGGFDPVSWRVLDSVFIYNFKSMSWRRGADMPGQQRLLFGCSSDSEKMVLVTGGHNDDKNVALRSVLLYDVEKDKWIVLPNMVMERYECKCILTEGNFHVIDGYTTCTRGHHFQQSAELFDFATSQWCIKDNFFPYIM